MMVRLEGKPVDVVIMQVTTTDCKDEELLDKKRKPKVRITH